MSELHIDVLIDTQGIILSGYGHLTCASFLFVQVQDTAKAKAWLRDLTPQVTTARPWEQRPDGTKEKPASALNIAFTQPGLKALGLPQETLATFSTEFVTGMTPRASILGDTGDSAPENWEIGGPNNGEIHAVLMLYANHEDLRDRLSEAQRVTLEANGGLRVLTTQNGGRAESLKEPFGFSADGLSQPDIEGRRLSHSAYQGPVKAGEFILGFLNEYGLFPPSPSVPEKYDTRSVLPQFPGGALPQCRDFGRHGTYLVYRKLEQDVAGFWQFIEKSATSANPTADQKEKQYQMKLLAAKLVGRWPSGAPIVLAPTVDDPSLVDDNKFTYRPTDAEGYSCPVGSHIRRCNPRDSVRQVNNTAEESLRSSNQHRLLRRGMPYGEQLFPPEAVEGDNAPMGLQNDGQSRGLHFFAINADIKRQFEFIQQTWINNVKFDTLRDSKDPLVGANDGSGYMTVQCKPLRKRINNVPRFVWVKGGEYFFMPSITSLHFLAGE